MKVSNKNGFARRRAVGGHDDPEGVFYRGYRVTDTSRSLRYFVDDSNTKTLYIYLTRFKQNPEIISYDSVEYIDDDTYKVYKTQQENDVRFEVSTLQTLDKTYTELKEDYKRIIALNIIPNDYSVVPGPALVTISKNSKDNNWYLLKNQSQGEAPNFDVKYHLELNRKSIPNSVIRRELTDIFNAYKNSEWVHHIYLTFNFPPPLEGYHPS